MVVGVIGALSGTSTARDLVDGWERGYYNEYVGGDPIPRQETWATYYSKYAQVRDGSQKQLANGVRWRLVTDQRTKIAMPRIVWMPDNKKRDIANRMLEMVHGGAMLFSKQQQEGFREYLKLYVEEELPKALGIEREEQAISPGCAEDDTEARGRANRCCPDLCLNRLREPD